MSTPSRLSLRRLCAFSVLFVFTIHLRADEAAMHEMGINSHLFRYSDYVTACDEIIASGVQWVRIGMEWNDIETAKGVYNAASLAKADEVVNRLHAKGVNIVWTLGYCASWASSDPTPDIPLAQRSRFYMPSVTGDWTSFVQFMADRYNNKISYWEVWNEPDSDAFFKLTPGQNRVEKYHDLLNAAYAALKARNPANQVLIAGLVMPSVNPQASDPSQPYMQVDFLDQLLARGAASKFDLMNYHAYGDSVSQLAKYQSVQAVLAKYGQSSKRIWLTETGYTTNAVSSREAIKADRIAQHWLNHMSYQNLDRLFWYADRNVVIPANANVTQAQRDSEENFGLRANDRTPLGPYFYYQALDGAQVDFLRHTQYPTLVPTQNTVHFSGSGITNYNASGSEKLIPVGGYMYFHVNDNWLFDANDGLDDVVYVDLEYYDNVNGAGFRLDYDPKGSGTNTQLPVVTRLGSGQWKTHTFVIPNVGFTNSNNGTADFRIYAGGAAALPLRSVVVRKRTDAARIKLGATDRHHLIERENGTDPAAPNYNPVDLTDHPEEVSRKIPLGKFMFMRVSDAFIRTGDTNVLIKVRFWNDGNPGPDSAPRNIVIQYNATNGATAKAVGIRKTTTVGWRTADVTITDADFRNAGSWNSDFRICTGSNSGTVEYVNHVEVTPLQLLADDFQDGDASGWSTTGSTWTVENQAGNHVLKQTQTSSGQTIAVAGQNIWNDYDYSADLKLYNASAAGLLARYTDANNYYVFAISTGLDRIYLKKCVAGATSSLVDIPWDFTTGVSYRLRLVVNGAWITAFVDGNQVASLYDDALPAGRVGARAINASYSIDNVVVR